MKKKDKPNVRSLFDFNKTHNTAITLEELELSRQGRNSQGECFPNRPIHSWDFIGMVHVLLKKHKMMFIQEDISVQNTASRRSFTKEEEDVKSFDPKAPTSFSHWEFNKLITRIIIPNQAIGDHELDGIIAIAYNSKGIQVAFGLNYRICSNLCILGGEGTLLTTGSGIGAQVCDHEEILTKIDKWLSNYNKQITHHIEVTNKMNSHVIKGNFIFELLGRLFIFSIKNAGKTDHDSAFQKDELLLFAKNLYNYVLTQNSGKLDNDTTINLWDLYNIGTNVLKPMNNIDLAALMPANKIWGEFLLENYINNEIVELNSKEDGKKSN